MYNFDTGDHIEIPQSQLVIPQTQLIFHTVCHQEHCSQKGQLDEQYRGKINNIYMAYMLWT